MRTARKNTEVLRYWTTEAAAVTSFGYVLCGFYGGVVRFLLASAQREKGSSLGRTIEIGKWSTTSNAMFFHVHYSNYRCTDLSYYMSDMICPPKQSFSVHDHCNHVALVSMLL